MICNRRIGPYPCCSVVQGDCLELMKVLPDGAVDAVITDPPYGVNKAEWDSVFPVEWIPESLRVSRRVACMSGNSALALASGCFGASYQDCVVLWNMNGMTLSKVAFGNWIPVIIAGEWKWEARPNLLKFVVEASEKIDHPSPKPLSAMLALLADYSHDDWTIIDPFCGSGTTLVAARKLGRHFLGFEISPEYCEIARKRLALIDAQPTLFEPKPEQLTLGGAE